MNIDILAGLGAAVEAALKSSCLENRSNRLGSGNCRLAKVIEVGDTSADQVLRRKSVSIYIVAATLVTTGDDSMKVSGKEDRVLQLVQNAGLHDGLQPGLKTGFIRPGRAMAGSASGRRFLRALRWRSLR